ncbi:signal recognition particle receptor beta subunit-domain-containing protein [Gautieria morchelliformis]|nr:signal recognition particle receptor beta subunit-domain-containing protein [Gautieria morchelliformis]
MEVTESQAQQDPPDLTLGVLEPLNTVQQCHASEGTTSQAQAQQDPPDLTLGVLEPPNTIQQCHASEGTTSQSQAQQDPPDLTMGVLEPPNTVQQCHASEGTTTQSQAQQDPPDLTLGVLEPPNTIQQCHASEGTTAQSQAQQDPPGLTMGVLEPPNTVQQCHASEGTTTQSQAQQDPPDLTMCVFEPPDTVQQYHASEGTTTQSQAQQDPPDLTMGVLEPPNTVQQCHASEGTTTQSQAQQDPPDLTMGVFEPPDTVQQYHASEGTTTQSQAQQDPPDLTLGVLDPPDTVQQYHASEGTTTQSQTAATWESVGTTQTVAQLTMPTAILDFSFWVPILGSLAAAVLFILVFALARKRKSSLKGNAVMLTGPSDAGKTAIYCSLVYERVLPSHTSLQTNASLITLPSSEKTPRTVQLLDVPGHPRIRNQFKDHIAEAKGVIFVVDASTIARNGAAVAEHLHHILHALASLPPSHTPPSLVILAHKCDLLATSSSSAALAVSRVRTILERELENRRASQAGGVGVGQLGEDESADADLGGLECSGPGGGSFKFKEWEGGEIEILGSSVNVDRGSIDPEKALDGLAGFRQWLHDLP